MDMGIRGRTAVVSGGSKGIGRAVSLSLAAEGANVAVVARGQAAIDETVEMIRAAGGQAIGLSADMTDEAAVMAAVAAATRAFSPPVIAISNVDAPDARMGDQFRCGFEDASNADMLDAFNTLVMSVTYLTRAVLPGMKAANWGRLLNIGTKAMREPHGPPTQKILSNIGRLGVVGLMKTLSLEYGIYNITANIVATGQIETDLSREAYAARGLTIAQAEEKMREAALGACRFGTPQEMANVVTFMCSAQAAYLSGITFGVTGGMQKVIM